MQDKLIQFRCTIINLTREKNTWKQYSFSTDEDVPTTTPIENYSSSNCSFKKRFGKISTFGVELTIKAEYTIRARTKQQMWKDNRIFTNLEAVEIYPILDEQGQRDFLRAITSVDRYNAIISVYPDFVDRIMKNQPIDLKQIKNVGPSVFEKLKTKIIGDYWKADIMSWLMPLGITEKMIQKLLGKYKSSLVLKEKLKENPYILTQIHGLGFYRVDDIVLKLFPNKKVSLERTKAFIEYVLMHKAYNDGDTVVFISEIHNEVATRIPECMDIFMNYIEQEDSNLYFINTDLVGLKKFYNDEKFVFDSIKRLIDAKSDIYITNKNYIEDTEYKLKFMLSDEQKEIVNVIDKYNFVIITGAAGVGKTSVIKIILNAYDMVGTALCSLSAKAANRITEVTGETAYTIHRLLKFDGKKFIYNKDNLLPNRLIIVDEGSMVDISLWKALLDAIEPGSKLVIVGDDGQLPPIGAGSIFMDLLESDFPICKLTKIYRQAMESGIIVDANMIRQGVNPFKK